MREFERSVGDVSLVVRSDASLSSQSEWLLRTLGKVLEATPFKEGMTIQMGWTRFSLRSQGGRVIVCEPAFHGNPFAASNVDVTLSLTILAAQDAILQELSAEAAPVSFHHRILIWRGCLSEKRVAMQRGRPIEGDDSGWYVGLVDQSVPTNESSDNLEWIRATELLRVRSALAIPLILPAGYRVVWSGDAIESVEAPETGGDNRWSSKGAEALRAVAERLAWAWDLAGGDAQPS